MDSRTFRFQAPSAAYSGVRGHDQSTLLQSTDRSALLRSSGMFFLMLLAIAYAPLSTNASNTTPSPSPCAGTTPCPTDGASYYYCQAGSAVNGCQPSFRGAFPLRTCTSQCLTTPVVRGSPKLLSPPPLSPSPYLPPQPVRSPSPPPPSPRLPPLLPPPAPTSPGSPAYRLLWSDEFSAGQPINQVRTSCQSFRCEQCAKSSL